MAVSLFDLMRPVTLFGGLGAACSVASARHAGAFGYALTILGALAAGIVAFWLSHVIAGRLKSRPVSKLFLLAFYVATFVAIALAAIGGGLGLLTLTAAV